MEILVVIGILFLLLLLIVIFMPHPKDRFRVIKINGVYYPQMLRDGDNWMMITYHNNAWALGSNNNGFDRLEDADKVIRMYKNPPVVKQDIEIFER